jgi:hypothetical protein
MTLKKTVRYSFARHGKSMSVRAYQSGFGIELRFYSKYIIERIVLGNKCQNKAWAAIDAKRVV